MGRVGMTGPSELAVDLLVVKASEVASLAGGSVPRRGAEMSDVGLVADGAVACRAGRIVAVGHTDEVLASVRPAPGCVVIDASGRCVVPGLVDCHCHPLFAGDRDDEHVERIKGRSYADILQAGGGIYRTTSATVAASYDELAHLARGRLGAMLAEGTTLAEAKTGYALTPEGELRLLRVASRLEDESTPRVVPTLLALHAVPPDARGDPGGRRRHVEDVASRLIPAVAEEFPGITVDVFCEAGAYTPDECSVVLRSALAAGLRGRLHAEELTRSGGAQVAARLGAVSADHLEHATSSDIEAMAEAGVVGVLLPVTPIVLGTARWAPAREMIERGMAVALGTDFNPGTGPVQSMQLVMSLAAYCMRMTPEEVLTAATLNSSYVLGMHGRLGSLEPGKQADMVVCDVPRVASLPLRPGRNLAWAVIRSGRVVARLGGPVPRRGPGDRANVCGTETDSDAGVGA